MLPWYAPALRFASSLLRQTRVRRALLALLALMHTFPLRSHLAKFLENASFADGWKWGGALVAIAICLGPTRVRRAIGRVLKERPGLAMAVMALLVVAHALPTNDHLPRAILAPSWADTWRGVSALIGVLVFAWGVEQSRRRLAGRMARIEQPSRPRYPAWLLVAAAGLGVASIRCSGATARIPAEGDAGVAGGSVFTDGGASPSPSGSVVGGADGGTTSAPGQTILYAHTDSTLYSFDPADLSAAPKSLGKFDCIGKSGDAPTMTDLAVAKDGSLFGVSETACYPLSLGANSVHCDAVWPLPSNARFYGLTVAPENTVDAAEVLIASNSSGQLFKVDATTGTTTEVGTLGSDPNSGLPWSLSGDVVFLANQGSPIGFATVRTCKSSGNCSSADTLIEVDVSAIKPGHQSVLKAVRGEVVRGASCTNSNSPASFGSMFGIAAFGDKVYGFSRKGDVVEINNVDGSGCLVAAYPSMAFAGAGVTTTAPVTAPPPK